MTKTEHKLSALGRKTLRIIHLDRLQIAERKKVELDEIWDEPSLRFTTVHDRAKRALELADAREASTSAKLHR